MRKEIKLNESEEELIWQAANEAKMDPHELLTILFSDFREGWLHERSERRPYYRSILRRSIERDDLQHPIKSRDNVMGGDHCIRNTRIPVWLLVSYKRQGMSDSELLANYPSLDASDLLNAWNFYAAHAEVVDSERRRHEEAA